MIGREKAASRGCHVGWRVRVFCADVTNSTFGFNAKFVENYFTLDVQLLCKSVSAAFTHVPM